MCALPNESAKAFKAGSKIHVDKPSADAWLPPDCLKRNPENPRVIFRQKDLDELKKSIHEVGILQPLIVYQATANANEYFLIDGERRWRCAKELNLDDIPVYIHPEPTVVQNITQMFNIHKLRVDWELMPTAMKLQRLIKLTGETDTGELARRTGMKENQIEKCHQLLFFPERHQQMVLDHEVKDNFLIEMHPFVRRLSRRFPNLFDHYGIEKIVDLLIEKERLGHIKAVTEFRDLAKLVSAADRGAPESSVKETIKRVLEEPDYEIETAFASVRALFDVGELRKRCNGLATDIVTFQPRGVGKEQLDSLLESLRNASRALDEAREVIENELLRG